MKKTFRTLLAGALALCAVACYDDSALQQDLAGVKDDLKALKTEFEAFQKKLNDEVSAFQTTYNTLKGEFKTYKDLTDGQVAQLNQIVKDLNKVKEQLGTANLSDIVEQLGLKADKATLTALEEVVKSITVRSVTEADGNIVITLANGETLTVAKDGEGVVKVVDGEWVAVGEDGEELPLELPVSTPNLQFHIDWQNGDLYYATVEEPTEDDWIYTGVAVGGNDWGMSSVITKAEVYDGYLFVTIDGEEYPLPLAAEGGSDSASLEVLAGKTIVAAGQTKVVAIKASGLSDVYVMSKPDGWKVSVNGNNLTITAPVAENPYAEQEGLILLHGTTEEGQCIVAKLAVTTSTAGVDVTVDTATGSVVFRNGLVMPNMGGGMEPLSVEDEVMPQAFAPFYIGIIDRETWGYVPEYGVEMLMRGAFMSDNVVYGNPDFTVAVDGSVQVISTNVNALWNVMNLDPMMEGAQMVVFAVPMCLEYNENFGQPDFDQMTYGFYSPAVNTMELLYETYNDIMLMVSRSGADYYYVGYGVAEESEPGVFESGMEGSFSEWQSSNGQYAFGLRAEAVMNERVLLSEYASEGETSPLLPSTTYYVFAFPVTEGKSAKDYVYETDFLPYIKYFTTAPITEGGDSKVNIVKDEKATTFTNIVADITVEGNAEYVYYKTYTENPVDKFEDEAEFVADIVKGNVQLAEYGATANISFLSAGTVRYIAAVAVDMEGMYGEITTATVSTKDYPWDTAISVTVDGVKFEEYVEDEETLTKAIVTYSVTGADYLMVKASWGTPTLTNNENTSQLVSNMMSSIYNTYVKYFAVVDGKVTVEYPQYTSAYYIYSHATGFNMDADENITGLCKVVCTDLNEYVAQ